MELIPSTPPGQTQCPANSNGLGEGWDIFGTPGFKHAETSKTGTCNHTTTATRADTEQADVRRIGVQGGRYCTCQLPAYWSVCFEGTKEGKFVDDELTMGVTCMRCDWMTAEHFAPSVVRRTE